MRVVQNFLALAAIAAAAATMGAAPPKWVTDAKAAPARTLPRSVAAQILSDEQFVDIDSRGTLTRRERQVVRILTNEGRGHAFAVTRYNRSVGRLVSLQGWLISPSGAVTEFKKKQVVEAAAYSSWFELYGDDWIAMIDGRRDAAPGSVFAFEAVKEERSVFAQDSHRFQGDIPCEKSSFSVKVPAGWRVNGQIFNANPVEPSSVGGRITWTLNALDALPDEPMAPSAGASSAWLAVDYLRPDGTKGSGRSWTYETWRAVSEQFTQIYADAAVPDASVTARANSVAAGAASRLEEIRALCGYVQGLNYVFIALNSSAGGGYIPRRATRVLACGYGDCKDKSTLLRSLLQTRGIESYAVMLFAGDPQQVQETWPSPLQFNHCIVAIKVDETVTGPAVVEDARLGRLLIFDPTVQIAPAGILPWSDQGGLALVLAGRDGGILRLPSATQEENIVERHIEAKLDKGGSIAGVITEEFFGNASVLARKEIRDRTPAQFREMIEGWLGTAMPAARALSTEPVDDFAEAKLTVKTQFEAPHGRVIRDRLIVFKPVLVARRGASVLGAGERRSPIVFEGLTMNEISEIELPPGMKLEDAVAPTDIEAPFGSYKAKARLDEGGKFVFERNYVLKPSVIPASEYKVVRDFFEKVIEAEQSPVVLSKE